MWHPRPASAFKSEMTLGLCLTTGSARAARAAGERGGDIHASSPSTKMTEAEDRLTVPGRDGKGSQWEGCSVADPGASLGLSRPQFLLHVKWVQ